MYEKKGAYIIAGIFGIVCWLSIGMCIYGPVAFNCNNFAVDSKGNLYIGQKDCTSNTIFVYNDGELVRSMGALTDRGYVFTIQPDDTMLWAVNSDVITTDLYGNEIQRTEDEQFSLYADLGHNKRFTDVNGNLYTKRLGFGTFKIYKNDTLIYKHPAYNQYFLITIIVSGLITLASVVWILKKNRYF